MTPAVLDRLRLERGARRLHALGPRAVAELLAEVGRHTGAQPFILARLAAYGRLTPALVRAAGADGFTPSVRLVGRS